MTSTETKPAGASECTPVADQMTRLQDLALRRGVNLFVFIRELEKFHIPTIRAKVDQDPAIGAGGVIVGYQLGEGMQALLAALESDANEIECRAVITRSSLEAATDALNDSGVVECPTPSNAETVKDILRAALPGRLLFESRSGDPPT